VGGVQGTTACAWTRHLREKIEAILRGERPGLDSEFVGKAVSAPVTPDQVYEVGTAVVRLRPAFPLTKGDTEAEIFLDGRGK
jgi:hypothetical protein